MPPPRMPRTQVPRATDVLHKRQLVRPRVLNFPPIESGDEYKLTACSHFMVNLLLR